MSLKSIIRLYNFNCKCCSIAGICLLFLACSKRTYFSPTCKILPADNVMQIQIWDQQTQLDIWHSDNYHVAIGNATDINPILGNLRAEKSNTYHNSMPTMVLIMYFKDSIPTIVNQGITAQLLGYGYYQMTEKNQVMYHFYNLEKDHLSRLPSIYSTAKSLGYNDVKVIHALFNRDHEVYAVVLRVPPLMHLFLNQRDHQLSTHLSNMMQTVGQ